MMLFSTWLISSFVGVLFKRQQENRSVFASLSSVSPRRVFPRSFCRTEERVLQRTPKKTLPVFVLPSTSVYMTRGDDEACDKLCTREGNTRLKLLLNNLA